jgi:spermidine/putrescine transport system ATP-binding protein
MQLELKEMHRKLGITFIYVTHDQEEALTMSDRIVIMKDGQIQQIGTPMDIYNEPSNAFVADFIGESNIYSGTIIGNKKVRFLGKQWECIDEFPLNEKVDIVVRPEDIKIKPLGEGNVNAKIVNKIFKGIHYQFTAMVGNNEVLIQSTTDRAVDQEVSLSIKPELIHIMKREFSTNRYSDAYINKSNQVVFADTAWDCDVTQILPGSSLNEEGYLVSKDGKKYEKRSGLCIEPQFYPNAINTPEFKEKGILKKGENYSKEIVYSFSIND